MKRKEILKIVAPFAGLCLLLAGCAVVTVDVDVYKGSLANHEDVQTEQLVSMAMGAKPLLIQLRDHLEWGVDTNNPMFPHGGEALVYRTGKNLQQILADVRTNTDWYRPGYLHIIFSHSCHRSMP